MIGMESAVNAHKKAGYKNCMLTPKIYLREPIEKQKPADTLECRLLSAF